MYIFLTFPASPLLRRNIKNPVTILQFHHQVVERLVCLNPLPDRLPVDALVVRVEVDKRPIHSLSRVFHPVLAEHPKVGLTLEDLPKHVDAVRYVLADGLIILTEVALWRIWTGVVLVIEEDCFADHVEAVQVVIELEEDWKFPGWCFEMVWTDAGADGLRPGKEESL